MDTTDIATPPRHGRSNSLGAMTLLLLIGFGPAPVLADDNEDHESRTRYGDGAALLLARDGYRDVGRESVLIPDLSIQHKWVNLFGTRLDLRLFPDDKPWAFVPRIGMEYPSSRYVDCYYGVRSGEAAATRPPFAGKSGWSPEAGLLMRHRASPRKSVFANVNYERHAKEIRDSPLIIASGIPQLILGFQYVLY